jgi:hypothetical protein
MVLQSQSPGVMPDVMHTCMHHKLFIPLAWPQVRIESQIIAQAGLPGSVTIATNMAGRGTDIILGGSAEGLTQLVLMRLIYRQLMRGGLINGNGWPGNGNGCINGWPWLFVSLLSSAGLVSEQCSCTSWLVQQCTDLLCYMSLYAQAPRSR